MHSVFVSKDLKTGGFNTLTFTYGAAAVIRGSKFHTTELWTIYCRAFNASFFPGVQTGTPSTGLRGEGLVDVVRNSLIEAGFRYRRQAMFGTAIKAAFSFSITILVISTFFIFEIVYPTFIIVQRKWAITSLYSCKINSKVFIFFKLWYMVYSLIQSIYLTKLFPQFLGI